MRFHHVHLEAFGHALPSEVTTSEELEVRLAPVYEKLNLSMGRLELMSGISERRFWPEGTRPSEISMQAAEDALARSGFDRSRLGMLIHSAVCRDFLEPATASVVHGALGLPETCTAFDLSNACLGFANAMGLVAAAIEAGTIEAGLVVAGEDGGPLVRQTIRALLNHPNVGRQDVKLAYASLTIASGGAACLLTRDTIATTERQFLGSVSLAATEHVGLCRGDHVPGAAGPLMETNSEALLHAGNALAKRTWTKFLEEMEWNQDDVQRVVTHQVGAAHRKLLLETLEIDPDIDYPTVAQLGNIGSVSLPLTFDLASRAGHIEDGQNCALLGIGSGLHCSMLGVRS
ncbi:MAG: 3-oxoacyl-[acyl-carrier-protein] synthase III [Candidatus Paceibacteria bacterium]|jgi:3-oxoacyl-[acyl-carrier-protein] synthase III